jgi:hypothetical protein
MSSGIATAHGCIRCNISNYLDEPLVPGCKNFRGCFYELLVACWAHGKVTTIPQSASELLGFGPTAITLTLSISLDLPTTSAAANIFAPSNAPTTGSVCVTVTGWANAYAPSQTSNLCLIAGAATAAESTLWVAESSLVGKIADLGHRLVRFGTNSIAVTPQLCTWTTHGWHANTLVHCLF